jgi:hypothetical protein
MTKSDSKLEIRKGRDKARPGSSKGSHGQPAKKKRGRPTGKRSDPDFTQTTAYIRADTYRDVRIALLQEGKGMEYSELVEEVLSDWLKKRK